MARGWESKNVEDQQELAKMGTTGTKMQIDPNLAPLLIRPTGKQAHPRQIFAADSPEADLIRQWATQFSTQ